MIFYRRESRKHKKTYDYFAGVVDLPRSAGKVQPQRQSKKRMQRHAPGVDGGNPSVQ